jgi:hypothetical protein
MLLVALVSMWNLEQAILQQVLQENVANFNFLVWEFLQQGSEQSHVTLQQKVSVLSVSFLNFPLNNNLDQI